MFYHVPSSLTVNDIEKKMDTARDKATIYRTLDAFEASGLIHRVPDKKNLNRYALCDQFYSNEQSISKHAHFICVICQQTYCLPEVEVPSDIDVKGYQIKSFQLTLEGECVTCTELCKEAPN